MKVGILAIQGAYFKHREVLNNLGAESTLIRHPFELEEIDALIIPGGESTTITKVLNSENWYDNIKEFSHNSPVFGTCAGAILLGSQVDSEKVVPWKVIDMSVTRNAYGRQVESFIENITWGDDSSNSKIPAVFIRAPKILYTGPGVEVLGRFNGEPVVVRQGKALATTFHPELTDNVVVHRFFIEQVCKHVKAA